MQKDVFGPLRKKMNAYEDRLVAALASTIPEGRDEVESVEQVWAQYLNFAVHRLGQLFPTDQNEQRKCFLVTMFERAVAMVCLSSTLWHKYIDFAAREGLDQDSRIAVCRRATRNVSFDSSVWEELLLAIEARGLLDDVTVIAESELLARTSPPLMDAAHCVRVMMTLCGISLRQKATQSADYLSLCVDRIFQRCENFMRSAYPDDQRAVAVLLEFQAHCIASHLKMSPPSSMATHQERWQTMWNEVLRVREHEAAPWLAFAVEYRLVHTDSPKLAQDLRERVFTRAADIVQDDPMSILEKWLVLELTLGDHKHHLQVRQRQQKLMRSLMAASASTSQQQPQSQPRSNQASTQQREKKRKATEASSAGGDHAPHSSKRPRAEAQQDGQKPERFTNDHTLFVCNIPKEATRDELLALFQHIVGLVDVRLVVKERASHMKSRGMAYVQFQSNDGVNAGLLIDGCVLHGQAIKVERSAPPPTRSEATGDSRSKSTKQGGDAASTTLYFGGLTPAGRDPISAEGVQRALETTLGIDGDAVEQVLILTDKRGKPKDYALVEFKDPQLVATALSKSDELQQLLGEQVSLQLSRMSIAQVIKQRDTQREQHLKAKQQKVDAQPQLAKKKSNRGSTADSSRSHPHSKPHARLAVPAAAKPISMTSLMPRALRKKPTATVTATATASSEAKDDGVAPARVAATASAPKSNEDFRKLLLGGDPQRG
ncbi:hypothetical protein PINS_up007627 [Pythium insidiosum]|nr:hypothetical protein PINS_up007627 [Pythium insidiosum]